ncbi:hypothetical protein F4811DRAFT_69632 [Daldinia bambusicola]|nr:hypothetical protein F4811DRAFT_69632 [Daldinia bambusicola]
MSWLPASILGTYVLFSAGKPESQLPMWAFQSIPLSRQFSNLGRLLFFHHYRSIETTPLAARSRIPIYSSANSPSIRDPIAVLYTPINLEL